MNELILICITFHCRNIRMFCLPTVEFYPHLTFPVGKAKSKPGYPVLPIQIDKKENPGINLCQRRGQRDAWTRSSAPRLARVKHGITDPTPKVRWSGQCGHSLETSTMNFRLRKGDVGVKNEAERGSVFHEIFWPLGFASLPACQQGKSPAPCFFMLIPSLALCGEAATLFIEGQIWILWS